jgi:hypothetical protein
VYFGPLRQRKDDDADQQLTSQQKFEAEAAGVTAAKPGGKGKGKTAPTATAAAAAPANGTMPPPAKSGKEEVNQNLLAFSHRFVWTHPKQSRCVERCC